VVWDREGEQGMRVIQRKGMGRKEGWKEGGRRKMTRPPKKFLDPPLLNSTEFGRIFGILNISRSCPVEIEFS
jgi:hypothetical protein